ncbi:cytohesin-interacting protein [Callorhinchus milii]|uniref:Cytohesin 1 interacting protein n=1 Tax=Callorhinchus milii TaxID=7868 RepID=A0A4W3HXC9_CALMI|nr:cytohesin-interacting protein [Callorhinchus milii]|eukprot:gi/632945519/ref/XP_007888106.1/ PREDICTED: cytohesin-interacting protein [Callorhinchus milii]
MALQAAVEFNGNANYMAVNALSSNYDPYVEVSNRTFTVQTDNKRLNLIANTLGTLPRGHRKLALTRSSSLADNSDSENRVVILHKQDNESFGFDIQTCGLGHKNTNALEMCTFICKVHDNSPSHLAGLKAGDILVNISGVDTKGFRHRDIVNLVRSAGNFLRLVTLNRVSVKRRELEARLHNLKQTLQDKWVEYRSLMLQEQRLVHGLTTSNSAAKSPGSRLYSSDSVFTSALRTKERFSSDSSCKSQLSVCTDDSEDGEYNLCVFDDTANESPIRRSSVDEECLFNREDDFFKLPKSQLSRSRSVSMSSTSSGPVSPSWDTLSSCGILPRKSKSVRKRIMKFIPGLNRAVEEDESRF